MQRFTCILSVIILSAFSGKAQLPDSLKQHIDSAFIVMQRSLYADKIDWKKETGIAYEAAKDLHTKDDLFPVITEVYKKLDDHHGWFQQYGKKLRLPLDDEREPTSGMQAAWAKGPKVVAMMIGDVAYIRIPGLHVYTQQKIDYCANWIADSVRALAAQHPIGWIIDLRLNTGGHIVPMMAGLASFFEEGPVSFYVDKNDKEVSHSVIKNKNYIQDDSLKANLKHQLPDLRFEKVAVLIGRGTGSSGEGVAFNFKYRKRTKLFGEYTAGVANATSGFLFNDEQSYFLLTTSQIANKKMEVLPMMVMPDVRLIHNDLFDDLENDVAVNTSIKYLSVKPEMKLKKTSLFAKVVRFPVRKFLRSVRG